MVKAKFNGTARIQRKVKDMEVSEVGYVVPWAFNPQTSQLDDDAPLYREPKGTVQLKVVRKKSGYECALAPGASYEWH